MTDPLAFGPEDAGCPPWCEGVDHVKLAEVFGEDAIEAQHFRTVAFMGFVKVIVTKPVMSLDPAMVTIQEKTTRVFGLKSHEARALGAWLIRAADRIDYDE